MKLAFAVLAHERPESVVLLVRTLVSEGDIVVVHYDANSADDEYELIQRQLSGCGTVLFAERVKCGWGEFSLVQATMNCLLSLESCGIEVGYVCLLSGSDLPIRPLRELRDFLHGSGHEFIESVPIREGRWIRGGSQEERFLYRFPFNKRRRKRLFHVFLVLQRWLHVAKDIPPGLNLSLGSQFWCLSWPTCREILRLCQGRPDILRFFRTAWIPDESFFQTLIRNVVPAASISNRSLTHYAFDTRGRPREYGDADGAYLGGLSAAGVFFARKISPEATQLRDYFLRVARGQLSALPEVSERQPPAVSRVTRT